MHTIAQPGFKNVKLLIGLLDAIVRDAKAWQASAPAEAGLQQPAAFESPDLVA